MRMQVELALFYQRCWDVLEQFSRVRIVVVAFLHAMYLRLHSVLVLSVKMIFAYPYATVISSARYVVHALVRRLTCHRDIIHVQTPKPANLWHLHL